MTQACVFCDVIAGRLPSYEVYSDADVVAFLDIHPAAEGHTLVVPRRHCADLLDADPGTVARVAAATQTVAGRLLERLGADGINVVQSSRAAAGQEVFHLHVHVIPRRAGDGVIRTWQAVEQTAADLAAVLSRVNP